MDPASLERLLHVLRERTGFDLTGYRRDGLARRAVARAEQVAEEELEGYVRRVADDDVEARALLEQLLVQVSGWFRDAPVWQVLRGTVLPALAARADAGRPVRAWVAGCGDGHEAYSLAACLAEATGAVATRDEASGRWSVLATDVDVPALAVLAGARYPRTSLPAAADVLTGHLQDDGPGWRVSEGLRAGVSWRRHDVRDAPPVDDGEFDLVLCRNLLMYLEDAVQVGVVDHLLRAVRPGGAVVLGQAETPLGRRDALVPVDLAARVYRSIAQPLLSEPG